MKIKLNQSPRKYKVGSKTKIEISDYGKIELNSNEQITFIRNSKQEYDITAKIWGFYATPSVNDRLKKQGFKTAIVKNSADKRYVMLVDINQISEFENYLKQGHHTLEEWLDERK